VDEHALRESGRSRRFENAVDGHDKNYGQLQQQAGRSAPLHFVIGMASQKFRLKSLTGVASVPLPDLNCPEGFTLNKRH
jgi:hypothetical protein